MLLICVIISFYLFKKKFIGPAPSTPVPKDEKQRDTDSDSGISGKNTALDNRFSHFYME